MGVAAALAAGTALQFASTISQGAAAADAAKFNIKQIQKQRTQEIIASRAEGKRRESSNIVAISKSGVRLTGSPLEVLAANYQREEEQRLLDFTRAQDRIELLRLRRDSARVGAGLTGAGQLLVGGAGVAREKFGTDS